MPANQLYHTWSARIRQLCPDGRKTLIHNFTWLIIGIYLNGQVHLSLIANKIPGTAKLPSKVQRLRRLLQNRSLCVRKWYGPIGETLLKSQAQRGHIRLIVDGSKVSFHHQLLMVSIAYRRRAIPIVWTWVKGKRGHSSSIKQRALLRYVNNLIPNGVKVSIIGDCEFGAVDLLRQLDAWEWQYVLRQTSTTLIDLTLHNHWQRFGDVIRKPGQSKWLGCGFLTKEHVYRTHLLAHWKRGEKEPWLLATNFPTQRDALRAYRKRMWIEEMFGDFKGHGFNLEDSHLQHFLRLSRLTLAVVLLYVWLVAAGSRAIKNGQRPLVDRVDRRDYSIFRIGYNMTERRLANSQPFSVRFIPYF
jgi:hypothetical protein